ncbi:MAG TPA: hypothetical protein VJU84_14365 [Pyrinomonadaceae bacterium]|nr:hypothetical protein [Pyrinomonadaceae bacterium]
MENITPEQNGAGNRASATRAVNLTYEQNVVRDHEGLDSLPGYVLVVFEKSKQRGAIFSRLVKANERFPPGFRIPFLDWSQKYFSIAVNDSVLSYTFEHLLTLDDGADEFNLNFHLSYRVADPAKLAEIREHDPLRQLRDEIVRTIGRNCAKRKAEMFRSRFRELEKLVITSESVNLSAYATTLGLKIISINLDKPLPDYQRKVIDQQKRAHAEKQSHVIQQDVAHTKQRASREWDHDLQREDIDRKFDLRARVLAKTLELQQQEDDLNRAEQNLRLREFQTNAVGRALTTVGENINTPADLREGYEVAREISAGSQSDNRGGSLPPALSPGSELLTLGSGEDRLSTLLTHGLREVDHWNGTFAQKQALRSTLLHIVAEALLDDHADEKTLKQYANKLSEIGKGFQPALGRTQRLFLDKFLNFDELKDKLR